MKTKTMLVLFFAFMIIGICTDYIIKTPKYGKEIKNKNYEVLYNVFGYDSLYKVMTIDTSYHYSVNKPER